ncbi:MAG: PQQ-binding-like beta-propeller repeat protein [Patescibacteria group bacterium]
MENYGEYAGAIAKVGADGNPVWHFPVRDFVHSSPIAVPGGGVVCGTNGGELVRLSSDGTELWCSDYGAPIKAGFCYVPETRSVCFGCHDGSFRCVGVDYGAELWKVETPYVVYSTPAYHRGGVFF